MDTRKFIEEKGQGVTFRYEVSEVLFSGQSEFQKVEVVQTTHFGKMLLNDDLVMLCERDEFAYHEMIAHVPLFVHPHPKKVLVIGGGDGGTAREVLRHPGVQHCDMVEIDGMVIDACREHIPQTAVGMQPSGRFSLHVEDGVKFVADCAAKTYDVIIVDSTDPIGPAQPLFGPDFYKDIYRCLADDGIVVSQGESPYYNAEMQKKLAGILSGFFAKVRFYDFHNMTYPGGFWSFSYASKGLCPLKDFKPERVAASGLTFQYYNEDTHRGSFSLPQFQVENLRTALKH